MSTTSAENLLLRLYKNQRLAPFYIIRGPLSSNYCPLLEWAHEFSNLLLQQANGLSPQEASDKVKLGHSDLLFITKEIESEGGSEKNKGRAKPLQDHKAYKVDDPHMNSYFKAVQYGPMELEQKFIFVDKGQLISEYFANKWLKTLEEPTANVTTLFLVENQVPLLNTIESRAITLRVQSEDLNETYPIPEEHEDFSTFLKKLSAHWELPKSARKKLDEYCERPSHYHLALDAIKEAPQLRSWLYQTMNDYMLTPNHTLYAQQHWLEEIKWFDKAETFNNSPSERFYGLLRCVIESTAHKVYGD
tara:strand:- start:38494 stop:39405 length:912 start_codon:yes stop_codon:yes gene_type:complete